MDMALYYGLPQVIAGGSLAAGLCLELPHRLAGVRPENFSMRQYKQACSKIVNKCTPELLCLSVFVVFSLALRMRGDTEINYTPAEAQVWEEIKKDWPILMGADTLLNMQAMIRLLVIALVAARTSVDEALPLSGMAAVLMFSAMVARTSLVARTGMYRLEGPLSLGGDLPEMCQVAMLPRLALLSFRSIRESPVTAAIVVSVATWFASHHYLNLAGDPSADQLFTLAHMFELFAAFAYLANTIVIFCTQQKVAIVSPAAGFMHLLMPLQQALSAYYFVGSNAFEPTPKVVGAGRPFCLICISNLLQLGLYLLSVAFYLGNVFDYSESSSSEIAAPDASTTDEVRTDALADDEDGSAVPSGTIVECDEVLEPEWIEC